MLRIRESDEIYYVKIDEYGSRTRIVVRKNKEKEVEVRANSKLFSFQTDIPFY